MSKIKLSDEYKHFDTLIWQAPSVGIAIAAGVVVAANTLGENKGNWNLDVTYIKAAILFFGFTLISALSIATAKYRLFQMYCLEEFPKPPFGIAPSAGRYLQGAVCLTSGGLLGLCISELCRNVGFVWFCLILACIAWYAFEQQLNAYKNN